MYSSFVVYFPVYISLMNLLMKFINLIVNNSYLNARSSLFILDLETDTENYSSI